MTRAQRLSFLGLALIVLVAAVVLIQPGGGDDGAKQTSQAIATPTATASETDPTPTPSPTVDPGPLLVAGKVTRIEVHKGDRVRLRAKSATAEEIHVHGYDLAKEVAAGRTAHMSFVADIEGIFEIEFENAQTQIAELRVEP
jgi:FtsP/CotA-like multicopper oxidase with cupredoxin domain